MRFVLVGILWLLVAIVAGASGRVAALQPPAPQLVLVALTAALIVAGWQVTSFRRWLFELPWRAVVALHLTRVVGLVFLLLYSRGELPFAFAVPGGIGDVVVAALAAIILAFGNFTERRPGILALWNTLGMVDILFVVVTAARLAMADPASMAALLRFPLSLVPTFLVPLIIASHVLLFVRLRHWERTPAMSARPQTHLT